MSRTFRSFLATAALAGAVAACGSSGDGAKADLPTQLTGAGATFPNPIYTRWFGAYAQKTGVQINYQSIGSGGGIRQFTEGTVDFGATDGPMTDEQIAKVNGNVVHIPTVLGAVVVTYNLPSLGTAQLKLDGAALADIFLGRITKWNDRRLAALNPGIPLPDRDLIVVHRSDGSGTSFVFTDYLSKVSSDWQSRVGAATSVNWPVGLGGKGNEGVTQQVKQVEGTVGYVELIYARSNDLPYAEVMNAAGNYVQPTLEAVSAAAASANLTPDTDFRVSITNAPGADAYPIASFTWLLVHADATDAGEAQVIRDYLEWMISPEAQSMASDLGYAPLPDTVKGLVEAKIKTLQAAGKALPAS